MAGRVANYDIEVVVGSTTVRAEAHDHGQNPGRAQKGQKFHVSEEYGSETEPWMKIAWPPNPAYNWPGGAAWINSAGGSVTKVTETAPVPEPEPVTDDEAIRGLKAFIVWVVRRFLEALG